MNNKKEYIGCSKCNNQKDCKILAIISFPIILKGEVIGGIGIHAEGDDARNRMINKLNFYIDFISKMSELIISKLEEKVKSIYLEDLHKRLSLVLEALDDAIISINEKNEIILVNTKFQELFQYLLNQ